MEISSFRSLNDHMGMEDLLFCQQWSVDSIDELSSVSNIASGLCEDFNQSFNNSQQPVLDFKRAPEWYQVEEDRPLKQLKTTTWSSCKSENMSYSLPQISSVHIVDSSSFNSPSVEMMKPKEESWYSSSTINFPSESIVSQSSFGEQNYVLKSCQGAKRISTNTRLPSPDERVLAERKRREKLSQRFITLSALVPGLKKTDKASVLGDAINYLKQLQHKVKNLEEQTKTRTMESVVFVNKYELKSDTENSSSDEGISSGPIVTESLPEIEARLSNKDVLIHILCEKKRGVLEKTVAEIEKLNLSVVNSNIMTFGDSALNISVVAQRDEELITMDVKQLVKNLRAALSKY